MPVNRLLTTSSTIDARLAVSPARYTPLVPNRPASREPKSDPAMASTTWGRNIAPYCDLERSYWPGSVKIVLAAGNVTITMPWTSPAV